MLAKRNKADGRFKWGYLTAFILLLASYVLTFASTQKILEQERWVNHTNITINTLDDLGSGIKDAESAVRGYIIMKSDSFLTDYYKTPQLADSILRYMATLIPDNKLQEKRLDTLKILVKNRLDLLAAGVTSFRKNNLVVPDSMRANPYRGKELSDSIKTYIRLMQLEEDRLLQERTASLRLSSNLIKVINIASLVIAIVLGFYSIISFNKENIARQKADRNAAALREQLEIRINELNKLNTELLELRSIEKFAVTGRLSRTIAHEIRNPLTNINLATEHLRSEVSDNAEIELLFDMITRNSNRINELISDLLNSTKTTQLSFEQVNVTGILDDSLHLADDRIELKKITVIKNYAPDLRPVLADTEKLKIAFLNIIVNAIEAMEAEKGILIIKTENKFDRCVVTITDNGAGMNKESLSKLFEPYFTTKEKGTGLGLTNVQNIILSHNANIYAESTEGTGTSFIISFTCS